MNRLERAILYPILVASSSIILPPAAYGAGSEYAFTQESVVDYRDTPFSAAIDCEALAASAGDAISFEARLVPAEGDVPEHCRINGVLPPQVGMQINLPTNWNGRLYMYGNGGYAGEDAEAPREQASRARGLVNGFATARTDTGHLASEEPLATFAVDTAKLEDHAFAAVHKTVVRAKDLIESYYARPADYSYFDGCSTGGRQGVMSAQRYPDDFNGIAAAAPTLDWTNIMIKGLWNRAAIESSGLTAGKMQTVFDALIAKHDASDGLADGLISFPDEIDFDPHSEVKQCEAGAEDDSCLTPAQADAVAAIRSGPLTSAGTPIFVSQPLGSEDVSTTARFVFSPDGSPNALTLYSESWMKHIAFNDPDYDWTTFDFDVDPDLIRGPDEIFNPRPDLTAFSAAGGKMVTFWGLADTALNPQMGTRYYDRLVETYGGDEIAGFYRLFQIPGVAHCQGGYGPDRIDAVTTVINWVEAGIAPDRLAATRVVDGEVLHNRAYCAYPARTEYNGSGDPEDPSSFTCLEP